MKNFIILTFSLLVLLSCAEKAPDVKIITSRDMPEPRQITSIDGKTLEEYNTLEIIPEIIFESNSSIRSAIIAENGRLYFGNNDRRFYALDIATGKIIWIYITDDPVVTKPLITDTKIIFNAGDSLYILNIENGAEIHKVNHPSDTAWQARLDRPRYTFNEAHAALSDDTVYYATLNGTIAAVNINSGISNILYTPDKPGSIGSGINIYKGNMYFTDFTGSLCSIDIETLGLKFKTEIQDRVFAPMHIENGKIYLGGRKSIIYCVDAGSGEVIWSSYSFYQNSWFSGGSVTLGDNLYTGTSDERAIIAYDKNTGEFIRSYSTRLNAYLPPILYDQQIIAAATNAYSLRESYISAFDTGNHTLRWRANINDGVLSTPAIYQNVLYFGSESGKIYKIHLDE